MERKKITNEKEYSNALVRLEQLMFNVLPGSKEGDELEMLSKMVEAYENEHFLYIDDGVRRQKTPAPEQNILYVPKKKPPMK